jgi:hypothetical protein
MISAQDILLTPVFDQDAKATGKTRDELAEEYARKLRSAIEQYRHDYSLKQIVVSSSVALLVTFFLIVVLFLLNRFYRKAEPMIETWARGRNVSIRIQSVEFVRTERIMAIVSEAMKMVV